MAARILNCDVAKATMNNFFLNFFKKTYCSQKISTFAPINNNFIIDV